MKRIIGGLLFMFLLINSTLISAQDESKKEDKQNSYQFTDEILIPTTSVKNQAMSSTCWSFSTLGFLESELLKAGKGEFDLSEMFIARKAYNDKADSYVRMHGKTNFGPGGATHDVTNLIKKYGIVPEEVYTGLIYGDTLHNHLQMDNLLSAYIETVSKEKNLSVAWKKGFDGILDAYLGQIPETFTYKGKEYTPQSFAKSLGINPDDYIIISSFTHHPFYEQFIMEVPDNWMYEKVYNVPMNEMMKVMDNALENGYSIAWAADVSDKGFSFSNGVAIVPDVNVTEMSGSDREKWEKSNSKERQNMIYKFDGTAKQKVITQQDRQKGFDNYQTQDDHGMQIMGIAKDQNGNKFYKVKNSWGKTGKFNNGYFYASVPFVELQTISIMVNKNAVPKDIKKKLGI